MINRRDILLFVGLILLGIFMINFCSAWADNGSLVQYVDGCGDLSTANAFYTLNASVSTSGTCFNITKDNVSLNLNQLSIRGLPSAGYGVYSSTGRTNVTIVNGSISGFNQSGATFGSGIYLYYYSRCSLENLVLSNNVYGLRSASGGVSNLNSLNNISFSNTLTIGTLFNFGGSIYNSNFSNIIINSVSNRGIGVRFTSNAANNTFFNFQTSSLLTSIRGSVWGSILNTILIYNNSYGQIKFSSLGADVSGDFNFSNIQIADNFAFLNSSSLSGLNIPANISLYNLPTNFVSPQIMKDGVVCSDCYNFTSLNAGNVTFNVTSWSTYSIQGDAPWSCAKYGMAGNGNVASPCQISNWTQLNAIRNNLTASYILMNNLSSATVGYSGLGDNWQPIGDSGTPFSGNFNGNFKTISDLIINLPSNDYVGLFGASNGLLLAIGLSNATIVGNSVVGSLVGYLSGGSISNCYSLANIISNSNFVGGLVGSSDGLINFSYSSGDITGGGNNVGGLVGSNSGIISNSYSMTNVTTLGNSLGGLVGVLGGTISNSYSTGKVINGGGTETGGFIGSSYGSIINSFWNTETSEQLVMCGNMFGSDCDNTKGKTTIQMKAFSTYLGAVWNISSSATDLNNGYPYLSWQAGQNDSVWLILWISNLTSCGVLDLANTVYTLQNNITTTGTCFTIAADNVTLDLKGYSINRDDSGHSSGNGVYISGYNNTTIKNGFVNEYHGSLDWDGYGIYTEFSENNTFSNLSFVNDKYSLYFDTSFGNNISKINSFEGYNAIFLFYSDGNVFSNVNSYTKGSTNFYLDNSFNNNFSNLYGDGSGDGFSFLDSSNNYVYNASLFVDLTGLYITGSLNNTFNLSTFSGGSSYYGLDVGSSCDNNNFIDYYFSKYRISNSRLLFENSSVGKITFLEGIDTNSVGRNISRDIQINRNSVYVNSGVSGLNKSANITFFNNSYYGQYPLRFLKIMKDGVACNDSLGCNNFTALTASTVSLNVSDFGAGNITLGKYIRSVTEIPLKNGWNTVSLVLQNNDSSSSRNISVIAGWNFIGYSSNTPLYYNDLTFTNSSGTHYSSWNAASTAEKVQRQIVYSSSSSSRRTYNYVPLDDSYLRNGTGYWVKAYESGNITLPGVIGSYTDEGYLWSDLTFRNSTGSELNVSNAFNANWFDASNLQTIFYFWNASAGLNGAYQNIPLERESGLINSWEGITLFTHKNDITMLRQD